MNLPHPIRPIDPRRDFQVDRQRLSAIKPTNDNGSPQKDSANQQTCLDHRAKFLSVLPCISCGAANNLATKRLANGLMPQQTPRIGTSPAKCSIIGTLMPASLGVHGPARSISYRAAFRGYQQSTTYRCAQHAHRYADRSPPIAEQGCR